MSRKNRNSVKGRMSGKKNKPGEYEPIDGAAILYTIYEDAFVVAKEGGR